jgi:hypothetical protein
MMMVRCTDTPNAQKEHPGGAIECGLTSKGRRQSSTTMGYCVLAVPWLADDSHLLSPSQQIQQWQKYLSLMPSSI